MTDTVLPPNEKWVFEYDGEKRSVTDITLEPSTRTIIGFERSKGTESTDKVKRYSVDKIKEVKKTS